MSNVTFAPAVTAGFEGSAPASSAASASRGSRLGAVFSGLAFLAARVLVYVGAAVLAAAACVVGVTLFVLQAALQRCVGGRHA